jgi:hypothetical protein
MMSRKILGLSNTNQPVARNDLKITSYRGSE